MPDALNFKSYDRTPRSMVVEEDYKSGINYTDNALEESFVKMLVNYNFKDDGLVLIPRGGFQTLDTIDIPLTEGATAKHPLVAFTTNVSLLNNTYLEDYRTKCFIIAETDETPITVPEYSPERKAVLFPNKTACLFVQDPVTKNFVQSTLVQDLPNEIKSTKADDTQGTIAFLGEDYNISPKVHGFELTDKNTHKPVYTVLNNVAHIVYRQGKDSTLGLGKIQIVKDGDALKHKIIPVQPVELSIKEVLNSGYNMLLPNPYSFTNKESAGYSLEGILPYTGDAKTTNRELLLSARLGQRINFEVYYQYKVETDVKLKARWEWLDTGGDGTWQLLQTEKDTNTDNPEAGISPDYTGGDSISINFEPTVSQFQLRVSLYKKTGTTVETKPLKMMIMPVYKLASDIGSTTKNLKPTKYNLATASGMTTWKQRIVLWGVSGAENIIFTSDINNPTYFPYPNNIDIFDENIIHIETYMDNLLVFTETRIYMLLLLEDGIGFAKQLVQNRLGISPMDKHVIQVIKNMIYFKSDNYYYMIVSKVNSIKGELLIAPVSKPIINLLDNFEEALNEILETVYFKTLPKEYLLKLIGFYNYVDNTVVRNVYTFQMYPPENAKFNFEPFNFNFVLNYDTSQRTWTVHCYQCNAVMLPFKQTITDSTVLLDVCNTSGPVVQSFAQLLRMDPLNPVDSFRLNSSNSRYIPNYQFLDTGYRKHGAQHKKRFREVQLKLNNTSKRSLNFYTEFLLDDTTRQTYYKYDVQHITDPNDPNYGLISVIKVIDPSLTVAGTTLLADENDFFNNLCWTLDASKLPPLSVVKVRFSVSGKGYAPRLKLISFNEQTYEFLNLNWVFRTMYAR